MNIKKPVIVVAAHNRYESIIHLLKSIYKSDGRKCKIIISIDGGGDSRISKIENYSEFNLNIELKVHSEILGLRRHLLYCGSLSKTYGSVIVLEDDLVVFPGFYSYAEEALLEYKESKFVGGISIYSPKYNEIASLPFKALKVNLYDAFFMRQPSSWGQAWSSKMWKDFEDWYLDNTDYDFSNDTIPFNVKSWSESSWKKYFQAYLIETDKYFLYPYYGFSSNPARERGVHHSVKTYQFLSEIEYQDNGRGLSYPHYLNDSMVYDQYMEANSELLNSSMDIEEEGVCFNLYGCKPLSMIRRSKYVVTFCSSNNFEMRFGVECSPPEMSVTFSPLSIGEIYVTKSVAYTGKEWKACVTRFYIYSGMNVFNRVHAITLALALLAQLKNKIFN
jgi:hypothetical protein